MKCTADSEENSHCDIGNERVHVYFRGLEKSIWALEMSWRYVSENGYDGKSLRQKQKALP